MIELLQYVSKLKSAPNGEALTATARLALMQIIIIGYGEHIEIDPEEFAPLVGLSHAKSVPRLLKQLEAHALLQLEYPRSKKGHRANTLCYPLPRIRRKPSNMEVTRLLEPSNAHVTWGVPSNIQALDPLDPSNMEVTRLDPSNMEVTRINPKDHKDLEPPSNMEVTRLNGTGIALNTPPPSIVIKREGERQEPSNMEVTRIVDHPAVTVWLRLMQSDISQSAAALIAKRVLHLDLWEETLEGWLASSWAKTNIDGQIERYEKKARNYTPPVESKPIHKDPKEEERIRSLMYADD
jgi:hypothetical protein